jgi:hypothetical protein
VCITRLGHVSLEKSLTPARHVGGQVGKEGGGRPGVCMQACIGENGQPLGIAIVATATCAGDLGGLPVGSAQTLGCEFS